MFYLLNVTKLVFLCIFAFIKKKKKSLKPVTILHNIILVLFFINSQLISAVIKLVHKVTDKNMYL